MVIWTTLSNKTTDAQSHNEAKVSVISFTYSLVGSGLYGRRACKLN